MINRRQNSSVFNLSVNLRALRKRMNWSQEELAEKMGLNRGNIASYESGSAEPKICNLVKFANLFRVSIFDLTHNNLNEEDTYLQATQRHLNGNSDPSFPAIDQYTAEAKEFETAIKGMGCMFNMKLREFGDLPEELAFLKLHFEQLQAVAHHLLRSHAELISTVKSKCKEHRAKEAKQQQDRFNA